MSVGSTFGRLFFGKLGDHPRVNRLYCFQIAMLAIGVADTLSTLTKSYAGLVVYMVVFGVFDGCFVVFLAVLCADIVGVDKVAAGIGVQFFFMAITSIAGPPLAGNADNLIVFKWIYERSYIWTVERYEDIFAHRSCVHNLSSCIPPGMGSNNLVPRVSRLGFESCSSLNFFYYFQV